MDGDPERSQESSTVVAGDRGGPQHLAGVERLKADALRLHQVVFQNVANMAPAAAMGYDFPLMAALTAAGAALVLSNVVAFVAVLLISSAIIQFAKKLPSAGGFYTYVSRGLGKKTGAFTGFVFFFYAGVLPAEVTVIWAGITQNLVHTYLHVDVSWIVWEALILGLVTFLAYTGVQRSARVAAVAASVEIGVFVALAAALLIHPVSPPSLDLFLPSSAQAGLAGILGLGTVYGILNFVGFEAAAPLAEETQNPRRNVPRSFLISACLMGVVYIFVAFAIVPGWGIERLASFSTSSSPFTELASRLWGPAWVFIYLAMTTSSLGCSLASTNASCRVLYSMGRIKLLPKALGRVHPLHKTPYVAVLVQCAITLGLAVTVGLLWGTLQGFAVLAVTLTLSAMVIYALGNLALPVFYLKEHRDEFSILKHAVFPTLAIPLLVYVLWRTAWSRPPYPLNVALYLVAAWMLVGVLAIVLLSRRRPAALEKSGLTVTEAPSLDERLAAARPQPARPFARARGAPAAAAEGVAIEIDEDGRVVATDPLGGEDLMLSLQIQTRVSLVYQLQNINPTLAEGVEQALRERRSLQATVLGTGADGRRYLLQCQLAAAQPGGATRLVIGTSPADAHDGVLAQVVKEHEERLHRLQRVVTLLNEDRELKENVQAALPVIAETLDMDTAAVFTVDGAERAHLLAAYGQTQRRGFPYPSLSLSEPPLTALMKDVRIVELTESDEPGEAFLAVASPGYGSIVVASASSGREVTALLVVSRRRLTLLSLWESEFITAVCETLGVLVKNRSLAGRPEHSAVLSTAYAVSRAISQSLDLDQTYREIAANAARVVPGCQSLLFEAEGSGGDLLAVASSDAGGEDLIGTRARFGDAADELAIRQESTALVVQEIVSDGRLDSRLAGRFDAQSALFVPLLAQKQLVGALLVYSVGRRRRFSALETAELQSVGEQAAIAIHNAHLFRNLKGSQQRVETLLGRLAQIREQERQSLARVVHDDIVQSIVGAIYGFDDVRDTVPPAHLEEFDRAVAVLRQSVDDARRVIWELRPPVLDGLGLSEALLSLADRADGQGTARIGTEIEDLPGMSESVTTGLYKIAREALLNAIHHAEAKRIWIRLRAGRENGARVVHLLVRDDGVGFDAAGSDLARGHFGRVMMEEQAAVIGGRLVVTSSPGEGARIEVTVPMTLTGDGDG